MLGSDAQISNFPCPPPCAGEWTKEWTVVRRDRHSASLGWPRAGAAETSCTCRSPGLSPSHTHPGPCPPGPTGSGSLLASTGDRHMLVFRWWNAKGCLGWRWPVSASDLLLVMLEALHSGFPHDCFLPLLFLSLSGSCVLLPWLGRGAAGPLSVRGSWASRPPLSPQPPPTGGRGIGGAQLL